MANQNIASFLLAIVLIQLGANMSLSIASSFPTLLTRNDHWQNARPMSKLIGWQLGPSAAPSPSPQPAPSPSGHGIKAGYWPSWLADSFRPSSIPTLYFTHVFYAFVGIDVSTYNLSITQTDDEWMANFTATLHSQNPPAKALLSIGGANASPDNFSTMASDPQNRAAFVKSTIDIARKYGFDGFNIDWEFPNNQDDMLNLSLLFEEWRQAVENEASDNNGKQPRLLLSAAVYFSSSFFIDVPRAYPVDAIVTYLDFVNPLCFNYRGSWDTSATGEHALLYDKTSNVSTSSGIESWIKVGIPPNKLVMGMPLYGWTWKLKDPNQHGIGSPAVGVGSTGDNGIMFYYEIVDFNNANRAHPMYDNDTVSEYSYSGTDWIGYDGPTSVKNKVEYAKNNYLGGYFFWTLGYDMNWTLSAIASNAWEGIH